MGMRPIESVKGELLACTFCAFCRRSCPVYRATLWEGESPRGRVAQGHGLLLGELEPSDEFYDSVLNCSLCGLCENACPPKIRVVDVVLAIRRELVEAGANPPDRVVQLLSTSLEGEISVPRADTVYLPGREGEEALQMLRSLDIPAEAASVPPLAPLMMAGRREFDGRMAELAHALKTAGVRRVVTPDPDELWVLKGWIKNVKSLHASQVIPEGGLTAAVEGDIVYLPSCRLRRLGIPEADRLVRSHLSVVRELECAGSEEGWLRDDILQRIVKERVRLAEGLPIVCASSEHARILRRAGVDAKSVWEAFAPIRRR